MDSVLIVGSIALDTVETPLGKREDILGGSATHFSFSASRFAPVRIVGVVGKDFPSAHLELLRKNKVDTAGLDVAEGKTFRWHGRYVGDMGRAETVSVQLNVLETFQPKVPDAFASSPFVLLGNSPPGTQLAVLAQLRDPKCVMMDTMNLWIETARKGRGSGRDFVRLWSGSTTRPHAGLPAGRWIGLLSAKGRWVKSWRRLSGPPCFWSMCRLRKRIY